MNDSTTSTNTSPSLIPANAFLIRPNKGASKALKAVHSDLKTAGCHWHSAMNAWSCPITAKTSIEMMLASKNIGVTLASLSDDYFCKNKGGQEAERVWVHIDILEKKHQDEAMSLLIDRAALESEIEARGLSCEDPVVKEKQLQLERREVSQSELAKEVEQLRNSAKLLEAMKEMKLPFHVLGYNAQREILIWKEGRMIALPAGRLNRDELRLYIGGDSEWFQGGKEDSSLKYQLIDTAHKKGFIDDTSPLRIGVWHINGKWLVISGKKAATIDGNGLQYLTEPICEGRLVETNGVSWLDWHAFEEAMTQEDSGLRGVFDLIYDKVKSWNWAVPSMPAFVSAFLLLSGVQHAMRWRPWLYLTGAKSTGKSTFFEDILQGVYGGLVERLDKSTAHATAQTIGNSGLIPVYDEFEKHKHIPDILELAKLFNRGGQKSSGTGAEKAHRYHLHHMPWFGSIYLPRRLMQDAAQESRIVKFELKKLTSSTPLLEKFDIEESRIVAAKLIAAMIRSWPAIAAKAEALNADRHQLMQEQEGIEIRTVENFMYASALLALLKHEEIEEIFPRWAATQIEEDGDKLLDTILASLVNVEGEKRSIGELLQLTRGDAPDRYMKELERYGLKLFMHKSKEYLAIRCEIVTRHLLKDTEYSALDIRSPLTRIEGSLASVQVKLAGINHRCVLIPSEWLEVS